MISPKAGSRASTEEMSLATQTQTQRREATRGWEVRKRNSAVVLRLTQKRRPAAGVSEGVACSCEVWSDPWRGIRSERGTEDGEIESREQGVEVEV
jgi:hypothetical protein